MNLYCVICFIAVFLEEVVARDISCINQILNTLNTLSFLRDGDFVCKNIKDDFEKMIYIFKKCTSHEIDFTKQKSLNEDMCNPDSDFSRELQRYVVCMMEKNGDSSSCYDHWVKNGTHFTKEKCGSFTAETVECLNKKSLQVCGDSGLKVSKRLTEAQEPFIEIVCLEVSSAVLKSLFTWLIWMATIIAVTWYQC